MSGETLKCDMCHKPLKAQRYTIVPALRPDQKMIVGPDCYHKAKKAQKELHLRKTPEEIAALREKFRTAAAGVTQ